LPANLELVGLPVNGHYVFHGANLFELQREHSRRLLQPVRDSRLLAHHLYFLHLFRAYAEHYANKRVM
jgi:hypothetical protein